VTAAEIHSGFHFWVTFAQKKCGRMAKCTAFMQNRRNGNYVGLNSDNSDSIVAGLKAGHPKGGQGRGGAGRGGAGRGGAGDSLLHSP